MAKKVTKLRVFAASPEDVLEERERLKEVIAELNSGIAEIKGLILQYVGWETDAWPGFGEDAQDVINKELIGSYDIFIGIMWKRLGTPTKRANSGTVEEFQRAYSFWSKDRIPSIMLYFNKAPFTPETEDDVEQMLKVLKFKKKAIGKGGLCWEYKVPDDFEKNVRKHLTKVILNWEEEVLVSSPAIPKLDFQFYYALFNELDKYIAQFEQLQRDYDRELNELYALMKKKGEFMRRTGEALDVLKKYLQDLQERFKLFAPEKVQAQDSKTFMENLAKWLEAESPEES